VRIERPQHRFVFQLRPVIRQTGDLTGRMNSLIRSSGQVDRDMNPGDFLNGSLDFALDGPLFALTL
jgi:hypothetical protein